MFSRSFSPYLTGVINHSIATSSFPDVIKLAKIMPAFKKDDHLDKENHLPINLLSHTSKMYEKILFNQIMTTYNFIFRPPDRLSEKSQYTTMHNKNVRKMETYFR